MRLNHGSWYEKKIVCTGITGTYMFIVFTSITLVNCDSQISLFPHYLDHLFGLNQKLKWNQDPNQHSHLWTSTVHGSTYEERLESGWTWSKHTKLLRKWTMWTGPTGYYERRGGKSWYQSHPGRFKHHWLEVQTGSEKELLQPANSWQLEWAVQGD